MQGIQHFVTAGYIFLKMYRNSWVKVDFLIFLIHLCYSGWIRLGTLNHPKYKTCPAWEVKYPPNCLILLDPVFPHQGTWSTSFPSNRYWNDFHREVPQLFTAPIHCFVEGIVVTISDFSSFLFLPSSYQCCCLSWNYRFSIKKSLVLPR